MGKEIYKETIKEFHHYNTEVIVDNTQVNELKNKINQMQNNQEMASLYFKQYVQNVQNNQEIMRNYYENQLKIAIQQRDLNSQELEKMHKQIEAGKNKLQNTNNKLLQMEKNLQEEETKGKIFKKQLNEVKCQLESSNIQLKSIKEKEEELKKKKTQAEKLLPKRLEFLKKVYSEGLSNKIQISQKQISEYYQKNSLFKDLGNKIISSEKLDLYLKDYIKSNIVNIINSIISNGEHFNIIVLGKTGVGKSTLINAELNLKGDKKAKTNLGKCTTQGFEEFISNERPGLRLIDSRGIEIGDYNIEAVIENTIKYIEDRSNNGDIDKFIHCIWYCIQSESKRVEDVEYKAMNLLMKQYENSKLPIIIVITQNIDDDITQEMISILNNSLQNKPDIVPVVAEEKIIKKKIINLKFHKKA